MIVASAGGGEPNAIITPRAIINSVSNGDGTRRTVDCCRSSEIILEGFVFSPALPIVLLNYSTGIPTVGPSPLRAAGGETLFCWKEFRDSAACLKTFRDIVSRKGVLVYKKCELVPQLFSHSMCLVRHAFPMSACSSAKSSESLVSSFYWDYRHFGAPHGTQLVPYDLLLPL